MSDTPWLNPYDLYRVENNRVLKPGKDGEPSAWVETIVILFYMNGEPVGLPREIAQYPDTVEGKAQLVNTLHLAQAACRYINAGGCSSMLLEMFNILAEYSVGLPPEWHLYEVGLDDEGEWRTVFEQEGCDSYLVVYEDCYSEYLDSQELSEQIAKDD